MKTGLLIACLMLFVLAVVSCGSDEPGSAPTTPPMSSPVITNTATPVSTETPASTPPVIDPPSTSQPSPTPSPRSSSPGFLLPLKPIPGGLVVSFDLPYEVELDWSVGTPPYDVDIWRHGIHINQVLGQTATSYTFSNTIDTSTDPTSRKDTYLWNVTDSEGRRFESDAEFTVEFRRPGG